jgi:FKBP-type peptidyl-prolyl cis-trans isomerase
VLRKGTGTLHPTPDDRVSVTYSAWTTDGSLVDTTIAKGQPATLPVNRVIAGWSEGLQLMTTGEKTVFWIPEDLAYAGRDGSPKGMWVYEVELLEILR